MIFGFLGFGKMASALVEGMLKAGSCKPEDILVINRHPEAVQEEIVKLGIQLAPNVQVVVEKSDVIVLGTKPADSLQLLREVRPALDGKLLISVAAGIDLDHLQDAAGHRTRLIRAMPNTPSSDWSRRHRVCDGRSCYSAGCASCRKNFLFRRHCLSCTRRSARCSDRSKRQRTSLCLYFCGGFSRWWSNDGLAQRRGLGSRHPDGLRVGADDPANQPASGRTPRDGGKPRGNDDGRIGDA